VDIFGSDGVFEDSYFCLKDGWSLALDSTTPTATADEEICGAENALFYEHAGLKIDEYKRRIAKQSI